MQGQFDSIALATTQPRDLSVTPTHMDVFMFSAVTWNRHHVHYNREAARAEGLPDVVVQRALIGNYFARHLTDWLGDNAEIRKIAWRVVGSAVPGQTLRCHGDVVGREGGTLACEMKLTNEAGETIATGTATIWICGAA